MTSDLYLASGTSKAMRRLVPFMCLLFLMSFVDRTNVSFAALQMNQQLGFTPTLYAWGVKFFFFGYVLFEVPANMTAVKVGARRCIGPMVIAWGFASMALAWTDGAPFFFTFRFLLGVAEAGILPGLLLYMTWWFPPTHRARVVAILMMAIPVSIIIGGPAAGIVLSLPSLNGALGFKPWQWLFILEGIPSLILGVAVYWALPDRPKHAVWLTGEEANAIEEALAREDKHKASHGESWRAGLTSPPVLLLCLAYFGSLLGGLGVVFWIPLLVKGFGLSDLQTGFVSAIPWIGAAVSMVTLGRIGDKTGKRVPLVWIPSLFAAGGLFITGSTTDPVLSIVALTIAAAGFYGLLPAFWTLPATYLKGPAVAGAFAIVNSVGALGGFVGPYIIGWVKETTGSFGPALIVLGFGALAMGGFTLLLDRMYGHTVKQ
jgi:MFS transporter, ACS family, tartrate transporter